MADGDQGPQGAATPRPTRRPTRLLTPEELPTVLGRPRFLSGLDPFTVPERAQAMLWGAPGAGKTIYLTDTAARVSQHSAVIYVLAEGQSGFSLRLEAWERFHGRAAGRLWIWPTGIDLGDDIIVASLAHDWQRLAPALVIIDTLSHCLGGLDENKSSDMMRIVRNMQAITEITGATVLVAHHGNKSGLAERGSSAMRAAFDVILHAEADDQTMILTCQKLKDGAAPWPPRVYRLRTVEVPDAADPTGPPDQPIPTSCVLVPSSPVVRAPRGAEDLTPSQAAILDMLAAPLWSSGATPTDMADTLNRPRISVNRAASALVSARWIEAARTAGRWVIADPGRHALLAWRATQATPIPPPLPPLRQTPTPASLPPEAAAGHLVYLRDYLGSNGLEKEQAKQASAELFGIEDSAALSADQVDRLVSHLHDMVVTP